MAGIRLHHPTLKGVMYTVEHPRRYMVPLMCSICDHVHERKTYHLNLDSEGYVIVSPVVYERLKEVGLAGMEMVNEVKNPPPLTIGGGIDTSRSPIVGHYLNCN